MFNIFKKKQDLFPKEECVLWNIPDIPEYNSVITNISLENYKYTKKFPYHLNIEILLKNEDDFHNNSDLIDSFDDTFLDIIKEHKIWIHFIDRLTILWGKDYGFSRWFNFYTDNETNLEKILVNMQNDQSFKIKFGYKIEFDENWKYVNNLFGK